MRNWYAHRFGQRGGEVSGKKLILHVGANKTGSSAIQRFLALNASALHSEGFVIPDKDFRVSESIEGHHTFSFQKLLANSEDGRKRLEDALDSIVRDRPETKTILMSAENLAANPAAPSLFEGLAEDFEVEVVMYIRRQDEFILSSWQQWQSKVRTDFWAWLVSVVGNLGDWQAHLQNWEKVIPRENIKVRVYERPRLENGDVIEDFHGMLGLSAPFESMAYPKKSVNPSYSDAIMDLVKGNDLIFENPHDNDFYRFVAKFTGDKYKKSPRTSLITMAQRKAILAKYETQNEWVKENYFPHLKGKLFSKPKEEDYHYIAQNELDREKLEFLTTMMYQLYKQRGK